MMAAVCVDARKTSGQAYKNAEYVQQLIQKQGQGRNKQPFYVRHIQQKQVICAIVESLSILEILGRGTRSTVCI